MSSIQVGALIYFTLIAVGAWIFFGTIFLQLKPFMNMNYYVPIISRILTVILVILTILGYVVVISPSFLGQFIKDTPPGTQNANGNYYTY